MKKNWIQIKENKPNQQLKYLHINYSSNSEFITTFINSININNHKKNKKDDKLVQISITPIFDKKYINFTIIEDPFVYFINFIKDCFYRSEKIKNNTFLDMVFSQYKYDNSNNLICKSKLPSMSDEDIIKLIEYGINNLSPRFVPYCNLLQNTDIYIKNDDLIDFLIFFNVLSSSDINNKAEKINNNNKYENTNESAEFVSNIVFDDDTNIRIKKFLHRDIELYNYIIDNY